MDVAILILIIVLCVGFIAFLAVWTSFCIGCEIKLSFKKFNTLYFSSPQKWECGYYIARFSSRGKNYFIKFGPIGFIMYLIFVLHNTSQSKVNKKNVLYNEFLTEINRKDN
jgi:hypothetical protein